MGRGPKKHLKRLNAPKHWMLDKLTGRYAPKPSAGPHKTRECLPLVVFLRNRLKLALTYDETKKILMSRAVQVDGKERTDVTYPCGFMDVISIPKTNQHFRLLYDVKGRFIVHPVTADEAAYKLCKVKKTGLGAGGIPHIVTHDGRTIRYPHPDIKVNDSVQVMLADNSIGKYIKFDTGVQVMVTGGRNTGRIGTIVHRDRHPGSFDIVHIKDAVGHEFATRLGNVFVLAAGTDSKKKSLIKLPKGKGVKLDIAEERDRRMAERTKADARAASS